MQFSLDKHVYKFSPLIFEDSKDFDLISCHYRNGMEKRKSSNAKGNKQNLNIEK